MTQQHETLNDPPIQAQSHEQKLIESERRFRALVQASSDVIYRMSPDWNEMHQLDGRNFLEDTGVTDTNWIEKYIPKEEHARVRRAITKAIKGKTMFQLEHKVVQANGGIGWTLSRAIPILDDDGSILEWFGTATDVTERRNKVETEQRVQLVTEQRNALIKINETKDEFIALASHQLRTPATAVKQYIGMLLGGYVGTLTDQQMKFLQSAYDSNERGLHIINDLLRTAQIDGTMPDRNISAETFNIVELINEVINEQQATIDQQKQTIRLDAARESVNIRMDVTEMKLALTNLIENASKYSYPKTEITVAITTNSKTASITIIDQGIGIKSEDRARIFEKFTRGVNEFSEKASGTGLGLYWVKQITEMHGGRIEVSSRVGKGSMFTLKLPIAK